MTAAGTPRRGISRAVAWTGIMLGTCLAILTVADGARLRIGGMPSWLGVPLGAVVVWALIVAASVTLAELTRRHHRAALRHGWRYGMRGGAGAARWCGNTASRSWRSLRARRAARAVHDDDGAAPIAPDGGICWGCGIPDGEPCLPDCPDLTGPASDLTGPGPAGDDSPRCPNCGGPLPFGESGSAFCPGCGELIQRAEALMPGDRGDDGRRYSWGQAGARAHSPARSRWQAEKQARYMSTDGKTFEVAEYPPGGGPGTTTATYTNGKKVQEGHDMTNTTGTTHRSTRDRARAGARNAAADGAGGAWRQLITATADYEPEDDTALLDWMAGEATGMAAYAEAITDAYDTAVSGVGLDPVPLAALHDYADAAAACAEAMAAARTKFAGHYEQVREFAAAGGLLPHDGRWITGEGT